VNAPGGPSPTRTIIFLAVACFASAASLRAADPILPEIARSFGTTPGAAAYIVSFFGIAYGFAQFGYGFAGDRFGKLRVIITATFLSAVTAAVCSLAGSLNFLIVVRTCAGITAAAIIPLAMAWIGDAVPYDRRQTVLARFLFGAILGITLGQFFGGVIAEHFGWRWVFAVLAAVFFTAGCALAYESVTAGERVQASDAGSETGVRAMATMLRRRWVVIVLVTIFLEGFVFLTSITFVGSDLWVRFGLGFDAIGLIVAGYGVGGLLYVAAASTLVRRLGEGGLGSANCDGVCGRYRRCTSPR
jgi:predicted MFS family arabinose efflux permease